jgi:hypothetical protein
VIAFQVAAALLLAALVLWLVLGPLFRPTAPAAADPLDDLVDPLETPKGRALAALRELEFDRATGKLSQADYEQLTARYSAEALRLQREEDGARPARPAAGTGPGSRGRRAETPTCPTCGPRPEADAQFCSACGTRLAADDACGGCGAPLAAGARFCSDCGAPAPAGVGT